jgi:hypothetical protein
MLVAAWAPHGPADARGCCIVPGPALARLFRRQGERGVRLALGAWLLAEGIRSEVRLVTVLPAGGAAPGPRPCLPRAHELRVEPQGLTCRVDVPYDLAIFAGHFPWVPIVPGAMIVGWAAGLAAAHGLWPHGVARIGSVKFRHIVQPGPEFRLRLAVDASRERLELRLDSSRALHAMGVLLAPLQGAAA